MNSNFPYVLIRGGGDLATGVAARLHRSGFGVIITEIAKPKAVRRLVALAEAVFTGRVKVEELECQMVEGPQEALELLNEGIIPVLIDPKATIRQSVNLSALVDARMRKKEPDLKMDAADLVIGLGPGFFAGQNCHAVVETNRGHHLGRVIWEGRAEPNTGVPGTVTGHDVDRVLRAPADGQTKAQVGLGSIVKKGEVIALVGDAPLIAAFDGALRGLIHESVEVNKGDKIGDLDPRMDPSTCNEISDKALAVGGGVLEVLLSQAEIRRMLGG